MLFKKYNDKYKNVSQIDISDNYSIIWCDNSILINDKNLISGNINYFKRFKNSFLVEFNENENETILIYDLNNYSKIKIDKIGEFLSEKIFLIGNWNQDYTKRLTTAICFNNNKVLWESERAFFKPFGLNDNCFLSLNNNFIYLNKIINSEIIWQHDLGTKYNYFKEADYQGEPPVEVQAEVIKFLGVYKNELWLVLNRGLLALNIETGTETRYIKEGKMAVGEPFFEDFKGYFGYDTFLDEEKGIIFSLNLHFYIEYDLNSNKNHFDSYSFKDSSEKNGLHLNHIGGYDAENIYAYEGSDNNRFAIFSRQKKEIIWSEEIPEAQDKFPAIRNLQYGAGKIYVLDHYNTLHIFDRGE